MGSKIINNGSIQNSDPEEELQSAGFREAMATALTKHLGHPIDSLSITPARAPARPGKAAITFSISKSLCKPVVPVPNKLTHVDDDISIAPFYAFQFGIKYDFGKLFPEVN